MTIEKAEKELYLTLEVPNSNWFTAQLIKLMFKADWENFKKLKSVYPEVAHVVERYKTEPHYWQTIYNRYKVKADE
jgi:hypothetical protein